MDRIETDLADHADPEKLKIFLRTCREEAIEDNHFKIASISMPVRQLDPLAVLDSIYESQYHHFYIENPSKGNALAGAEAVVKGEWNGPDRFINAKAFIEEVLDHTVAIGDLSAPFSGPHFYTGFTFEDGSNSDDSFPAATVFLPHWQVGSDKGKYIAVANFRIDPDGDLDGIVDRIWKAYQKFSAFDYSSTPLSPKPQIVSKKAIPPLSVYEDRVGKALEKISAGIFEKVVISRAYDLEFDRACEPLKTLNNLRVPYQNCYLFSFHNEKGESFIGATPERLLKLEQQHLSTEALAGSEPRGKNSFEDAELAHRLLSSDKDIREHQHVIDSILKRLNSIDINIDKIPAIEILALSNVQHLRTRIEKKLHTPYHLLDIAAVLHPTPAVGGTPREAVMKVIPELESYSRNLYTGIVGWVNAEGEGELVVVLRTALIRGDKARLFAGAGIVDGSIAKKECLETEYKMKALLDAMTD